MNNTLITYEPDNSLKKGYLHIFPEIFSEIVGNRWLIWQLFKRDFFALYKQSFIGIWWALLIPLISVGTFIILNRSGIFSAGDIEIPYPLYAVIGIAFWQLFSTGLVAGSNSLVKAGAMISKINFSKKSLVIASVGQSIIAFAVQLVLVIVIFLIYGIKPQTAGLFIFLTAIPIELLSLGMGFIFALLNGIVRDIGNVLSIAVTFMMFLTPVLYSKPESGILAWITKYNPMYYLISASRELMLKGSIGEWYGFIISALVSFILFLACLVVFHLTETRISERI